MEDKELKPYFNKRSELSSYLNYLLWKNRVIVPLPGRAILIEELHKEHLAIAKMKSLARTVIWWPGLDENIHEKVQCCTECQALRPSAPLMPFQSWEWPLNHGKDYI